MRARKVEEPFYIKKKEVDLPGWEGEWDRVRRMRKEGHPLMKGGQYKAHDPLSILFLGVGHTKGIARN